MSKERLSGLQKWILTEAYKRGRRNLSSGFPSHWTEDYIVKNGLGFMLNQYWIGTDDIHKEYFGHTKANPVKSVILCRSIATLGERGYFETKRLRYELSRPGTDIQVVLSEKGIDKAKSIMVGQKSHDYTIRKPSGGLGA